MTHKIILSDSAYSTMVDNFFAMKNRAEAAEEQLTGAAATIVTLTADVTRLSCERDEWIDAYRKQEIAYSASINDASEVRAKRDAAWSELRKIREEIGARIDESTYDEVASFKRQYERVHAERDEEHQKGVTLTAERDAAIDRFAQLESDNDEMQSYINEIRVALHTEKDELTIEAVRRVISERDKAQRMIEEQAQQIEQLTKLQNSNDALARALDEAFNSGDGAYRP